MGSIVAITPLMAQIDIEESVFGDVDKTIDGDSFANLVVSRAISTTRGGTQQQPVQYTGSQTRLTPAPTLTPTPTPIGNVINPINIGGVVDPNVGVTIPSGEGTWGDTGGGGFGGGGFGGGGFGGGGFGGGGFGGGGEEAAEPTALGVDALGCPIYGYDENGTPLYGVDQNGNIITDPSVLPCAMKAKENASVGKPEKKDRTLLYLVLGVGAVALYAAIKK